MTKSGEWIGSISRIEVTPGGDGVLSTEWRVTVTLGQRVLGVVVVSHQPDHGVHVSYTWSISGKYQSSGGLVIGEPVSVLLH